MSADDPERQRRLAEALRANLRRRKGQARERAQNDGQAESGRPTPDKAD
ncbi:MAG: hypothetical protein J7485_08835 [Sphingobium sp.]|nr:hypothetical protein [Sphingobium sp.]